MDRAAMVVKNWSRECNCSKCGTIFLIDINDLVRYDDLFEHINYFILCPVCQTPYRVSVDALPAYDQYVSNIYNI